MQSRTQPVERRRCEKSQPETSSSETSPRIDLTPDADGKLSQEQMQQLFRVVADKDIENDKRQRDYTYIDREVAEQSRRQGSRPSPPK